MAVIQVQRIYESSEKNDGFKILVDRLWPRGIKKEDTRFDVWMKEIAPSNELRKWFNHDPEKWEEFKKKYVVELTGSPALEELLELAKKHKNITLLYAAKDKDHNQAVALKEFLDKA